MWSYFIKTLFASSSSSSPYPSQVSLIKIADEKVNWSGILDDIDYDKSNVSDRLHENWLIPLEIKKNKYCNLKLIYKKSV